MPEPGSFERYFHDQAELAEELYRRGHRTAAKLLAAVTLDSLAQIWEHDYGPKHFGGSDLRLAAFIATFAEEPQASHIAVVLFAEDLARLGPPRLAPIAKRLLAGRAAAQPPLLTMEFGEMPYAHRDADWRALIAEEPELDKPTIEKVARHYMYPALVYRLIRCGLAHSFTTGSRTTDFSSPAGDDEISYFGRMKIGGKLRPISIKFGILTLTRWLRTSATLYAEQCERNGKRPADNFDASNESLAKLDRKWKDVR